MGFQNFRNAKSYGAPPAAVTSPVSGTTLLNVWNLQAGGTGSAGPYTNGTLMPATPVPNSTTNMPAYLIGKWAQWGNNYSTTGPTLWFNIGASTVSVSNYDFSNSPYMLINGTGTITFTNCLFSRLGSNIGGRTQISGPSDINGNITTTYGSTLTINFVNCTFQNSAFYGGSGTWNFTYCKWQDMLQGAGDTYLADLSYNWCYFPGIGVGPTRDGHVEITQFNGSTSNILSVTNCMIDCAANGQAAVPFPGGTTGWTSLFAFNGATPLSLTFNSNIMIGLTAVNASSLWPNPIPYTITLTAAAATKIITNNILQSGSAGYLTGKTGATVSGNRTYANAALTAADFGA